MEDPREGSQTLQRLLQNTGFRVAVDHDGIEGLEDFRSWRPDLIWLDLYLPGTSGVEAARRVRLMDWGQPVKVMAISAPSAWWERDERQAPGLDGVVQKPYRRREIFDSLGRVLGVRYNYGTNVPETEGGELLTLEGLSALPEKLCGELEEALVLLDVDRVTELIHRVEVSSPALGGIMANLSDNLAYTSILHAIAARRAHLVEERK